MKRQIRFTDEVAAYRFTSVDNDTAIFEIKKDTLTFSSGSFYKAFFKGLTEKPEYELIMSADGLKGQAKHVFDTVSAIFKKACDSIDDAWFDTVDAGAPVAGTNALEETDNQVSC